MLMRRLRVSIIIATYNRSQLVCEAIDSLLAQTRLPDEIIVIDDGSTDDTSSALANYSLPVKVIHQENRGQPAALNVGLRTMTCDLIAFLDSDDTLPVNSIARRAEFLETRSDAKAVYGGAYMTDMQNNVLGWFRKPPFPRGMIFAECACNSVFPIHAVMFRRECVDAVGLFDETLKLQLDLDYWTRFSSIYPFEAIDEPLAYYRVHENMSILAQSEKLIRIGILVQSRVFNMPAFAALTPKQRARVFTVHGTQYLKLDERSNARHWYLKAIGSAPAQPQPYVLFVVSLLSRRIVEAGVSAKRRLYNSRVARRLLVRENARL